MKQCRECGTFSTDEIVFCPVCGTRFPANTILSSSKGDITTQNDGEAFENRCELSEDEDCKDRKIIPECIKINCEDKEEKKQHELLEQYVQDEVSATGIDDYVISNSYPEIMPANTEDVANSTNPRKNKSKSKPIAAVSLLIIAVFSLFLWHQARTKDMASNRENNDLKKENPIQAENTLYSNETGQTALSNDEHSSKATDSLLDSQQEQPDELEKQDYQEYQEESPNSISEVAMSCQYIVPEGFACIDSLQKESGRRENRYYNADIDMTITIIEEPVASFVPQDYQSNIIDWFRMRYDQACAERDVTYNVFSKNRWYVVSGYSNESIFYEKTLYSTDVVYELDFLYPQNRAEEGEKILLGFLKTWS